MPTSNVGAQPAEPASAPLPKVAALTRGMVRGEEGAYRSFYDAYFNRLFGYLFVVTRGDEQAARDAVQATLVRVVRHIKVFPDDAQFWRWLAAVARSAFADERRKHWRYLSFLNRFARHAEIESVGKADLHADEHLQTLLQQAILSLDADEQELIEQKYFARCSIREIADQLQSTEKAVESKLVRIRRRLKNAVVKGLNDEF